MSTPKDEPANDTLGRGSRAALGAAMLAGAVAVFVICSLVQSAGDSSMFSSGYPADDSIVQSLLINVTFYPGWIATIALGGYGTLMLASSFFDPES